MVFLTSNTFTGVVNNPHDTMVTWVDQTIQIKTNGDPIDKLNISGKGAAIFCWYIGGIFNGQSDKNDNFIQMNVPWFLLHVIVVIQLEMKNSIFYLFIFNIKLHTTISFNQLDIKLLFLESLAEI